MSKMKRVCALLLVLIGLIGVASDVAQAIETHGASIAATVSDDCPQSESMPDDGCGCGDEHGMCSQCGIGHCSFTLTTFHLHHIYYLQTSFNNSTEQTPSDRSLKVLTQPPIA